MKYVWKCRKCGREYPEDTKTGSGENDLSVYENPSAIVARACHDCIEPVDLVAAQQQRVPDAGDSSQ
jgi:hypothetical protein